MDQNKFVGSYDFVVEPFTEDFQSSMSWSNFANIFLRVAQYHAGSHGFGFGPMSKENLGWVFSRFIIDMQRRPKTGEKFRVRTWVSGIFHQFTSRLFDVSDEAGNVYGHAYSIWALIDLATRQPIDLLNLPNGSFADCVVPTTDFPISGPARFAMKSTEPAFSRTAKYSDLDVNGHVNSVRTIEMVLDLFPKQQYEQKRVRRIDMAYAHEAFCGERLDFFVDDAGSDVFNVCVKREGGQITTKSQITFEPR